MKIAISPGQKEFLIGGPVPLTIEISNTSDRETHILVTDYRPRDVKFSVRFGDRSVAKSESLLSATEDYEEYPASIRPGMTERFHFDLNRFADLAKPGQYDVDYTVRIRYRSQGVGFKEETIQGSIAIQVKEADESALRQSWQAAAGKLGSSNRLEQLECAEALCYVADPRVVEYVGRVVKSDLYQARLMGVTALQRIETREANSILQGLLLTETCDGIVGPVLALMKKREVRLSDEVLRRLLNAPSSSVRLSCLAYLKSVRKPEYLDIVSPLTQDRNPAVSNAARQVIEELRTDR